MWTGIYSLLFRVCNEGYSLSLSQVCCDGIACSKCDSLAVSSRRSVLGGLRHVFKVTRVSKQGINFLPCLKSRLNIKCMALPECCLNSLPEYRLYLSICYPLSPNVQIKALSLIFCNMIYSPPMPRFGDVGDAFWGCGYAEMFLEVQQLMKVSVALKGNKGSLKEKRENPKSACYPELESLPC